MNPLDDTFLNVLLSNDGQYIAANESDTLEFKSDFVWSDKTLRAKYTKSFAALANNKGGYLVFGVEDKKREITGITDFDKVDTASIADHLNNYFSPAITFYKRSVNVAGKEIGVIYVDQSKEIPTVCIRTYDTILKDGALFYRYSGKSDMINGTDLINLLHQLRAQNSQKVAEIAEKDFRLKVKPRLWANGGSTRGLSGELSLFIENDGEKYFADAFEQLEGDNIAFNKWQSSFAVGKGQAISIFGKALDKPPQDVSFVLVVYYHDQEGYKYESTFKWKGGASKLIETKEL